MRIGVLTAGGDCPGLNAAIRGVTRRAISKHDDQVLGIKNGWDGLIEGDIEPLSRYSVSGILHKGGTILGTSRHNPLKSKQKVKKIIEAAQRYEMDAIVVIGGEDAFKVAHELSSHSLNFVGIPKSIDNDVPGTDLAFGFDTAINIVTEAIDRLHTTAESHHRVMILEVMGRYSGALATVAGIAGGADYILVPEEPFSFDDIVSVVKTRKRNGKTFSIIVVTESATCKDPEVVENTPEEIDEFGHPMLHGKGEFVRKELAERLKMEVRVAVLGHIQRGGTPTAADRVLATSFGIKAVDLVHEGKFNRMAAMRGMTLVDVPFEVAMDEPRRMDPELMEIAKVFFG